MVNECNLEQSSYNRINPKLHKNYSRIVCIVNLTSRSSVVPSIGPQMQVGRSFYHRTKHMNNLRYHLLPHIFFQEIRLDLRYRRHLQTRMQLLKLKYSSCSYYMTDVIVRSTYVDLT